MLRLVGKPRDFNQSCSAFLGTRSFPRSKIKERKQAGSRGVKKKRATMNASDADRQIKQMVNFILQEAQEKANEIRIKVRGRG